MPSESVKIQSKQDRVQYQNSKGPAAKMQLRSDLRLKRRGKEKHVRSTDQQLSQIKKLPKRLCCSGMATLLSLQV